jgi:hypothetical protein
MKERNDSMKIINNLCRKYQAQRNMAKWRKKIERNNENNGGENGEKKATKYHLRRWRHLAQSAA